jgi:hypothetical protein
VEEALHRTFGYVIAFILPGLVAVDALRNFGVIIPGLESANCAGDLSLSAWIVLLLGSLGVGLVVSAFRWMSIDTLHHRTGLAAPALDFSRLHEQLDVFLIAVEHSYRYYQFYSNSAISLLFTIAVHLLKPATAWPWPTYAGLLAVELLLLAASRDCLRRYYQRVSQLGQPAN